MKIASLVGVVACFALLGTKAQNPTDNSHATAKPSTTNRTEPLESDITDRERRELLIRENQSIGKVIVSPDGKFFLYEWRRPYSWDKDFGSPRGSGFVLTNPEIKKIADHLQSWLYRVDPELSATDSRFLFLYESASSYWLGSLSPDLKKVSFYTLDNDDHLRAGAWDFDKKKPYWFPLSPDPNHLDSDPPLWLSNSEFLYRVKGGKFARASLTTGKAALCSDCGASYAKTLAVHRAASKLAPSASTLVTAPELGANTKLLAKSLRGDLSVYVTSTPDRLALRFQKGSDKPETVFENSRRGSGPPPEAKPEGTK